MSIKRSEECCAGAVCGPVAMSVRKERTKRLKLLSSMMKRMRTIYENKENI